MNDRKQKLIIIGALCLIVTLLSIGYAVLSANLKINGTARVSGGKWSVEFVEKQSKAVSKGKAICDIGNIVQTSITDLSAKVKVPGDSCTFTILVENTGTLDANLVDVTNKGLSLSYTGDQDDIDIIRNYITYNVRYGNAEINDETAFDSIDILEPGERETITLRVEFKEEATQIPNNVVTVQGLDRTFNFENKVGSSSETSPMPETTPIYHDTSGANQPVLSDNMIPVVYDETRKQWVKQDLDKSYDYSKQIWANAVTVVEDGTQTRNYYKKAKSGTVISMNDINTMWVWIPRYSYTIKSEDGNNYFGKASSDNVSPSQSLPGEIDVKFIPLSEKDVDGSAQYIGEEASGWFTPPGFTFGDKDLSGVWLGKFETSNVEKCMSKDSDIDTGCDDQTLLAQIKPNVVNWKGIRVSTMELVSMQLTKVNNIYGFDQNSYDSHVSKNSEWVLMSYLTQSKYGKYGNTLYTGENKEVYMNNYNGFITGCSSGKATASTSDVCMYRYDNMTKNGDGTGYSGAGASTTGNIYGIYDVNGGSWENVMAVLANPDRHTGQNEEINSGYSGILENGNMFQGREWQDDKYYDLYSTTSLATACTIYGKAGSPCIGHAFGEVERWYGDWGAAVHPMFIVRGAAHDDGLGAGTFCSSGGYGSSLLSTFRIVLTPNN